MRKREGRCAWSTMQEEAVPRRELTEKLIKCTPTSALLTCTDPFKGMVPSFIFAIFSSSLRSTLQALQNLDLLLGINDIKMRPEH